MFKIIGKKTQSVKNLGGKGYSLLRLDRLGLTPNFLIISNSVNRKFGRNSGVSEYLSNKILFNPDRLASLKKRILKAEIEPLVTKGVMRALKQLKIKEYMVRSSFCLEDSKKFSYAGLFDSYRCKDKKNLPLCIKKVWASQFNDRVYSYQQRDLFFGFKMAVVIQDFINPDYSGVVFIQNNTSQEILVEYGRQGFNSVTSGKSFPYTCLLRNNRPYAISGDCKKHRTWIESLIRKVLTVKSQMKSALDIEFAVSNNKVYLLQARPLTKPFAINNKLFLFSTRKYKGHIDDISDDDLYKFCRRIGLEVEPFRLIKEENSLFMKVKPYFSLIDELERKAKRLSFTDNLYDYTLGYASRQKNKLARQNFTQLIPFVISFKRYLIEMYFINFITLLLMDYLRRYLAIRHNIQEDKNPEYFTPTTTIATQALLDFLQGKGGISLNCDWKLLGRLNRGELRKLYRNIQSNRESLMRAFRGLDRTKKRYFNIFRKLAWLHDANNYYERIISGMYHKRLYPILESLDIIEYFKSNLSKVCAVPSGDLSKIRDKGFLIKVLKEGYSSNNGLKVKPTNFPLKGRIASQGNFEGIARIIRTLGDIKRITSDDIMIAEYTFPSLVVGMAICRGIITEVGGLTSHAAIVSRELGKPCVVGVIGCTKLIRQGDRIKVINGSVYRLK
ncbi:MAG: hypothetical protein JRI96_06330 [Deltaproteobacteria bacterium]|nr:hypothetical protein [Deltaproteobacteria bacterium]